MRRGSAIMRGMDTNQLSIVIRVDDRTQALDRLLAELATHCPGAEVIVVDDGSPDDIANAAEAGGARMPHHPAGLGSGAAVKTGIRTATRPYVMCMEADDLGAGEVTRLLEVAEQGYDCVTAWREWPAPADRWGFRMRRLYQQMAVWLTGKRLEELFSTCRLMRTAQALTVLSRLPNGAAHTGILSAAFLRLGHSTHYVRLPENGGRRPYWADILQARRTALENRLYFTLILLRVGMLGAPQRITLPVAGGCGILGLMFFSGIWLAAAVVVLVLGLVAEQTDISGD